MAVAAHMLFELLFHTKQRSGCRVISTTRRHVARDQKEAHGCKIHSDEKGVPSAWFCHKGGKPLLHLMCRTQGF